jgi:hypothetical protein
MASLWNALDGAMRTLVGAGAVKQRLIDAWRQHLGSLQEKDVPDGLRSRLATLRAAMHTAHPTGGMSAAEVSVRKMSDGDAAAHAERVLEMYAQLCATYDFDAAAAPRLRVVGGDDRHDSADELPAFLSRA